ncbi:MAG: cache domain-containing protein [Bryobacterales bacterium]|nr:cache domain-containing protein [Bryobacterales bacterium]
MSPEQRYEPKIPYTRVLLLLMVIIIPISIYGFYTIAQADVAMQESIGNNFRTIAESNAYEISSFIHDRVIQSAMTAVAPDIRRLAEQANARYRGMSDAAFESMVQTTEKNWNLPAGSALVKEITGNAVSENLRNIIRLDPRYLRITITDDHGCTIAASHKTLDYYQADEDFWQAIYAQGRGAVSVTDVLYDDVTRSNYIGIGVPIIEPGSERFIGTLDALVDVSELSRIVKRSTLGPTARISLVKDDGVIISAPSISLSMNQKSQDFDAVSELLRTQEGVTKGYTVTAFPGGTKHLVAVADTGLKRDYKNLSWLVLVGQDTHYAFTAIRTANTLISFVALAGLAFLTLLVVVFDMNRKRQYVDLSAATGVTSPDEAR